MVARAGSEDKGFLKLKTPTYPAAVFASSRNIHPAIGTLTVPSTIAAGFAINPSPSCPLDCANGRTVLISGTWYELSSSGRPRAAARSCATGSMPEKRLPILLRAQGNGQCDLESRA